MPKKHAGRPPKKLADAGLPADWKEQILIMSGEGMSEIEIRARLCCGGAIDGKRFSQRIWYALQDRDEEFRTTIKQAQGLCQAWWEKKSRECLYHGKENVFETGAWYANMKNRFGWRDKTEIDGHESGLNKIANALQMIRKLDEKNGKSQKQ